MPNTMCDGAYSVTSCFIFISSELSCRQGMPCRCHLLQKEKQIRGSGREEKKNYSNFFETKCDYDKLTCFKIPIYTIPKTYLMVLSCVLSPNSSL